MLQNILNYLEKKKATEVREVHSKLRVLYVNIYVSLILVSNKIFLFLFCMFTMKS
jgi:hypothetical protein